MDKAPSITSWAGKDGAFDRQPSQFRNVISKQPGAEFPPEGGRYHLYVSYACPWGQFTLSVSVDVVTDRLASASHAHCPEIEGPGGNNTVYFGALGDAREGYALSFMCVISRY